MKGRVATLCRIFSLRRLAGLLAGLSLLASAAPAGAVTDLPVFEPKRYDRLQGGPTVYTDTFDRCEPSDLALLRVWNGDGKVTRITAAEVFVNGAEIFAENEFKKPVDYLEKLIRVRQVNELRVILKSGDFKEPSFLRIAVLGKNCDATAPIITAPAPAEGALLNDGRPRIAAAYGDETKGSGLDLASVRLTLDGADVTAAASVGASGIEYQPSALLPEGTHQAVVTVSDRAFNAAELAWSFTTDTISPVAQITSHAAGAWVNTPVITLAGALDDPTATVVVNGTAAAVTGNTFSLAALSLNEGENMLTIFATDPAGNSSTKRIVLNLDTVPPVITIAAPLTGFLTNIPAIDVAGSVNEPALSVAVNGVAATLDGQQFSRPAFALVEEGNTIEVQAVDRAGNIGTASVHGTLDTLPPAPPVPSAPLSPTNVTTLTVLGSAESVSNVKVFAQAPGTAAFALLDTVEADGSGKFTLPAVTLAEGVTRFTATATDAAGNESEVSASVSVHLDTVAPVITTAAPPNGSLLKEGRPTLAASFTDEAQGSGLDLASARLLLDGSERTAQAQVAASGMQYSPASNLPEGSHTATAQISDLAGNPVELSWQFITDTIAPVPAITSQADGEFLNTPVVTVSGTLDDPTAIVTVNGVAAAVTGQSFSLSGVALAEGENTLIVIATDPAGNAGSQQILLNLDTVPPLIAVTSPQPEVFLNTPAITVSGSVDEPVLSVAVNGQAASVGGTLFNLGGFPLTEGRNSLEVVAIDRAGNRTAVSVPVVLDTVPPTVSFTSHVDGAFLNTPTIALTGGVDEPVLSVSVNGAPAVLAGGAFHLEGVALAEGSNGFTATAVDRAGNLGSASLTLHLDTAPPVLSVSTPPAGAFLNTPVIPVSGSVSEPVLSLTVNGTPAQMSGESFTITGWQLAEGENELSVVAVDRAGNSATLTVPVVLDTVPPTVTLTAPPQGLLTNQPLVNVAGTADEPILAATVNGTAALLGGQGFTAAAFPLAEGENLLTATVTDRAGNVGTASVQVKLDTIAPQPPLLDSLASPVNVREATLSGSAEPLTIVRLFAQPPGSVAPALLGVTAADAAGRFAFGGVTLAEGSTLFTATATDAATNESGLSAAVAVTLDTVPPVVTVDAPAQGLFTNATAVAVSGSVDEPVAQLTVGGVAVPLSSKNFSRAEVPLAEGENTLAVVAFDLAGNKGSAAVTVHRDTLPPTVTIAAPADGLLTNVAQVDVSGSVDEPVTAVSVGGAPALLSGQGYALSAVPLAEGENTLSVSAVDRAGNVGTASVAVRLDSTPPAAPALDAPVSPTNVATLTLSGAAEPTATVKVFATPPGGGATALLATVAADVQGGFSLEGITLAEGETAFTATATDPAGNESAPSAAVAVTLDTVPPVITVTSPADHAVSDALDIRVVGTLNEAATLTLDDAPVALEGSAFDHPVTLVPGVNTLILLATDAAGNSAVASLTLHADSTPPTVTLTSPPEGLLTRNHQVTVAGNVSETATLTLNGASLPLSSLGFSTVHTLTEGENTLTVTATDAAGNVGSAAVRVVLDTTAPTLSLSVPSEGNAGQNLPFTVAAADGSGLALVEVRADGVPVWSASPGGAASLTDAVTYTLSPTLTSGATVDLEARAVDAVGNATTAGARITVAQGASGPGYLLGEAYDDRRGLRLAGAAWRVSAEGATIASGETAEDGGYFLELAAGDYLVRLEKAGYTIVERQVTVRSEQTTAALDARLTPISATTHLIGVLGGEVSLSLGSEAAAPSLALTLPADTLPQEVDLRLTPVSNQGLAGLLPAGWSPLAAFELRALDAVSGEAVTDPPVFAEAASLQAPLPQGVTLPEGSTPTLARFDETKHAWIAAASAALDAQGGRAETVIMRPGHYALLLPDPGPIGPPAAVPGEALPGAAVAVPDYASVTAAGRVVPVASPAAKGVTAVGELVLTPKADAAQPLVSGLAVTGRVTERFDLASGETVQPADYVQDLLLYRAPCLTNPGRGAAGEEATEGCLRATFPVSPSRDYTLVELLLGKVGVEIRPAAPGESGGVMVGASGARLIDADGTVLEIPAGALSRTTPVSTREAAGATALVGADFRLLRAVLVDLAGETLSTSAILSIPAPEGFDVTLPVVVAAVIEAGGVQKLRLVGIGRPAGSMLVSSASFTQGLTGAGIVRSGTYCFLQAKGPLGFVRGTVSGQGGAPFAGALVTASTTSLADVTGSDGRYLLAAPVGSFTVSALDLVKSDRGIAVGAIAVAGEAVTVNLSISATPPGIMATDPADGATGISASAPLTVTFNEPLDRATVSEQTITLKEAGGNAVPGVFSFNPQGAVVTFYPAAALKSQSGYLFTIAAGIKDLQGYSLGQEVTVSFTTRDTTPPPMPAAGAITATFPDEQGMITVTATQGSAEAGATVLVINDTSGEIVSVVPQTNGSFTARIAAQLGDEIQIVLMDAAGNQTLVSYLTFKAPDGRYLVTARGGKVEGEGGSRLEIPEGALVGPAVVKLTLVPEPELPHAVPEITRFLGAVQIDTGGVGFRKEVKLSVPAPPDMPAEAVPFLTRPITHVNPDGTQEELFQIVNSAKVIDGRITTASPPFAGVLAPGTFAFLYTYPVGPVGGPVIVSGTTYRDMDGLGGYMPGIDQPIRGAVIRSPGAENFIAYSDSKGHYASYGFTARDVCRNFAITAIHPQTMLRNTANITTCDAPYIVNNFNFKLADKDTQVPDKAPPVIELGVQVAPGQNVRTAAGTVPVGTKLQVTLSTIDEAIRTVLLTAVYKEELTGEQSYSVPAGSETEALYRPKDGEAPPLFRTTYQPQFSTPLGTGAIFQPNAPGFYTLMVEATDEAGNTVTLNRQIRAVAPGAIPAGIEGPPFVLSIIPGNNSPDVRIDTSVRAVFSEMVDNVTESTFLLIDTVTGQPVPAIVTTGVEEGTVQAVLLPRGNLHFGRRYEIVLTTGITDAGGNQSAEGQLPLAAEARTAFTTQSPRAYDLVDGSFADGKDIDLYFDAVNQKTYSYVSAGDNGWRIADVTDSTKPRIVYPAADYRFPTGFSYRGVAVDQDHGRLAITENIVYPSGGQYGYVRFYDVTGNPTAPVRIAQEKLAESYSGIPGRLALNGQYAYIATVNAGLQVVDIDAAIEYQKTGRQSDGSTIVGAFDSVGQGFGHPNDILIYKEKRAILGTTRGYLVALDLTMPQIPMLVAPFQPEGVWWQGRFTVAPDYAFEDADGSIRSIDLVVAGTRDGQLRTVDFTDPANPRLLGIATDDEGKEVTTWTTGVAINRVSGLAFVSIFNAVQVFDIKDPTRPRLLSTITEVPDENGSMVPIGALPDLVEHNGWVYLASQAKGIRTLNLAGKKGITYFCDDCYANGAGK